MKKLYFIAGFALLLAYACQQEAQTVSPADNGQKVVITEITGALMDEPETKTTFEDGTVAHGSALHINWSAADGINVWFNDAAAEVAFISTNTTPASAVSFSGILSVLTGTGEGGETAEDYMYGYYPYTDVNTISNGVITASLPVEQEAVANNIANNLNPWAARSTSWSLKFYNVGCWLRFKVSRDDIRYVELSGNNGEKIAGTYSVGFDANGIPTIADCSNGAEVIRLNAPDNGTFATDTWYYIALLPTEFTEGFTLKAYTASQIGTFSTSASVSFDRGSYVSYSSMASSMTFQSRPVYFTAGSGNQKIVFATSNLQYIGSTATPFWRFAEHPWDMLGTTTGQNSSAVNVDRDLFGWATSGYLDHYPYMTSNNNDDYGPATWNSGSYEFDYNWDWGNNIDDEYTWRTPSYLEWYYVLYGRTETYKYAKGNVHNVNGLLVFPDGFDPLASGVSISSANSEGVGYDTNHLSNANWDKLAEAGVIFLPITGLRNGTSVYGVNSLGYYWSKTGDYYEDEFRVSFSMFFDESNLMVDFTDLCYGMAVRLVRDIE